MKQRYRLYHRANGGRYYLQDNLTGKQESLHTTDRKEAIRLLHARNEAAHQPLVNVQIARAYLAANDPEATTRTWGTAMTEIPKSKQSRTKEFYERCYNQKAFGIIRDLPIVQTRPEHFIRVLEAGTVATNKNLRRLHNFALAMAWVPWPVLSKQQWPDLHYAERRSITFEEHRAILAKTDDEEFKAFLELAWHIGAAQGDLAALKGEDIDCAHRVISFRRQKTGSLSVQRFSDEVAAILARLPNTGPLFPELSKLDSTQRAAMFRAPRDKLKFTGNLSLHSYRYAWAERARSAGFPERFAQEALGHKSKAVHAAYARKARVEIPALEEYEKLRAESKVVPWLLQSGVAIGVSPLANTVAPQAAQTKAAV
jgi:integrase